MGISLETSGIKVKDDKCFLVNLNADPALNELLVYYLKVRPASPPPLFLFGEAKPRGKSYIFVSLRERLLSGPGRNACVLLPGRDQTLFREQLRKHSPSLSPLRNI